MDSTNIVSSLKGTLSINKAGDSRSADLSLALPPSQRSWDPVCTNGNSAFAGACTGTTGSEPALLGSRRHRPCKDWRHVREPSNKNIYIKTQRALAPSHSHEHPSTNPNEFHIPMFWQKCLWEKGPHVLTAVCAAPPEEFHLKSRRRHVRARLVWRLRLGIQVNYAQPRALSASVNRS